MCLICVEMQRNKMTPNEVWENFLEMREGLPEEHVEQVQHLISDYIKEKVEEERNESRSP